MKNQTNDQTIFFSQLQANKIVFIEGLTIDDSIVITAEDFKCPKARISNRPITGE